MKLVNIHTHHVANDESIQLVNHRVQDDFQEMENVNFSVGIHPWDIAHFDSDFLFEKLQKLAGRKPIKAIGECGIDRFIETSITIQEPIFVKQIELAEQLKKPLIIHAVKSYSDLIRIKKSRVQNLPWILHGYNGNVQTTEQLLRHDFYFSFGPQLLKRQSKLIQSLKAIPLDKLFFETDDSTVSIETIYTFAARQLGRSMNEIQEQLLKNYKRILKNG